MAKRDKIRASISSASAKEKPVLLKQYKSLRNNVTARIRKESIEYNNSRISKAKDESEVWNIVNEVINPNKDNSWRLNIGIPGFSFATIRPQQSCHIRLTLG